MPRTRERWIEEIRNLLGRSGFYVADSHGVRPSSFDLAARRDATLLLIKVLKNIDALGAEEATRLLELGHLFPATVLIVGQDLRGRAARPGGRLHPVRRSDHQRGDPRRVPRRGRSPVPVRESRAGRSPASPGNASGSSGRRAAYRSERSPPSPASPAARSNCTRKGREPRSRSIERLETYLGEPIVSPILCSGRRSPGRPPAGPRPAAAPPRLRSKGPAGGPTPTRSARPHRRPVARWGHRPAGRARIRGDRHRARPVRRLLPGRPRSSSPAWGACGPHSTGPRSSTQLSRVAEGHAMFVVAESVHRPSIGGLPILNVRELRRHRDRDDLFDELSEREGP